MPIMSEVEETSSDVTMNDLNERICSELLEEMNEAVWICIVIYTNHKAGGQWVCTRMVCWC